MRVWTSSGRLALSTKLLVPQRIPVAVEERPASEQPVEQRGHLLGVQLEHPPLPRLHRRERLRADVLPVVLAPLALPDEEAPERIGPVDERGEEDEAPLIGLAQDDRLRLDHVD